MEIEKSVVVDVVAYAKGKCWVSVVETCVVGIFAVLYLIGKPEKYVFVRICIVFILLCAVQTAACCRKVFERTLSSTRRMCGGLGGDVGILSLP